MDVMLDALDIVLNNNLITERHTLLTARLVCREWKTMEVFSGRITSVTLYRPADVQLAARLVPGGIANNRPFPKLSMLRIPHSLSLELSRCNEAVAWFAACEPVGIHILETRLSGFIEASLFYKKIGGVGTSLDLFIDSPSLQQLGESIRGVCVFTGLTRLRLVDTQSLDLPTWSTIVSVLTACPRIRHLQLEGVCLSNITEVSTFLTLISKLPQVTQLDLSLNSTKLSSNGGVEAMQVMLHKLAPPSLHDCKLNLTWDEAGGALCSVSKEFSKAGKVQTSLACTKTRFDDSNTFEEVADSHLMKVLEQGPAPKRLELVYEVIGEVPGDKFQIDVSAAAGSLAELMIDLRHHTDEDFDVINGPEFKIRHSLLLGITKLELKYDFHAWLPEYALMDASFMLVDLLHLCSHLQHLEIYTAACLIWEKRFLTQLTKLTHLTFRNCRNQHFRWMPLEIEGFTPSLIELVVDAEDLKPCALVGLEHLTKLVVYAREAQQTFEPVYACNAPLRYLGLHKAPQHVHLFKIASAFPTLETLDVELNSITDIRCLSDLKILREVKLELPEEVGVGVCWLKELTSIQVLTVQNQNSSVPCFKALEGLTQLRSLTYMASSWPSQEGLQDLADAVKELRKKLPYTQISASSVSVPVPDAMLQED